MLFQKTLFIFTLFSTIFIHTSNFPSINSRPRQRVTTITDVMQQSITWLEQQQNHHTATTQFVARRTTIHHSETISTTSVTLLSQSSEHPLVNVRLGVYYYFSFTPYASPTNLSNTPLAQLLTYLRDVLPTHSGELQIPLSETVHMACQEDNGYIHCVKRGF